MAYNLRQATLDVKALQEAIKKLQSELATSGSANIGLINNNKMAQLKEYTSLLDTAISRQKELAREMASLSAASRSNKGLGAVVDYNDPLFQNLPKKKSQAQIEQSLGNVYNKFAAGSYNTTVDREGFTTASGGTTPANKYKDVGEAIKRSLKGLNSTVDELKEKLDSLNRSAANAPSVASTENFKKVLEETNKRLETNIRLIEKRNGQLNSLKGGTTATINTPAGEPAENRFTKANTDAARYETNINSITTQLKEAGVSGESLARILASVDAQVKKLSSDSTLLDLEKPLNFTGGKTGKFISPVSFNDSSTAEKIPLEQTASYNKLTGETALEHKAAAEAAAAQAKAEREIVAVWEQAHAQNTARTDPTLSPLMAKASRAGFGANDLERIRTQGEGGIRVGEFSKIDSSGVVQKYTASISRAGDVTESVGRQFRTFGQSVVRDVGELAKWSIAMAVIYGPIQKLGEITSLMIQNEVALASATIAVNDKFSSSEKIFNAAALAANNAGEEINKTIGAFTASYRATGGGADETTRFSVAQKLLADSMTLAKLAGIDESQAIDTLSAALRQQGSALTEGSSLLDKWVRVTQVANVDMNTLATGFAVMGETADAAGIDVDKLNGIIATVAETGLASGKEAANSARRIVTAFQTPGAIAELQKLGIATEDANGKARSFLEIGQQIYEMTQKGLISKEAMSNLTLIAGQGVRGQAALAAVLGNFQRIGQVEAESKNAQGGEAAKALEKQLSTAQTAITRFNNAWQEFAQTLGTKGGLLDLFKGLTNGGTAFVQVLNATVGALGKATPMVIAMTAAMIAFYRKPAETRQMYGENLLNSATGFVNNNFGSGNYGVRGGMIGPAPENQGISRGERFANSLRGASAGGVGFGQAGLGAGIGIAASIIPAAMNYASGDKEKAYADVGGGIAGGILGSFVGGPMGAMVGSSIGTSMAEVFLSLTKGTIEDWSTGATPKITPGIPNTISPEDYYKQQTVKQNEATRASLNEQIFASMPGGTKIGGFAFNQQKDAQQSAYNDIQNKLNSGDLKGLAEIFSKDRKGKNNFEIAGLDAQQNYLKSIGVDKGTLLGLAKVEGPKGHGAGTLPPPSDLSTAASLSANPDLIKQYYAVNKVLTNQGANPEANPTGDYINKMQSPLAKTITEQAISQINTALSNSFASGKVKSSVYTAQVGQAKGAESALPVWQTALGQNGADPKKTKELLDVITYGSTEAVAGITNLAQAIIDLQTGVAKGSPEELKARMGALKEALSSEALNVKLNQAPIRSITGDVNNPLTSKELGMITSLAQKQQKTYYSSAAGGNLSDSDMKAYIEKTFEPAAVPIKDAADLFYKVIEGIDPQFFKNAMDELAKEGKLTSQDQAKGIDFQQFKDVDRATLEKLAGQSVSIGQSWQQKFNYGGKAEDQIAIAKDGVAKPLHADFKILSMLLEKLVDQGQKQLDGMFNMPDGANFWVNLAAAQMHMETANAQSLKNLTKDLYTGTGEANTTPVKNNLQQQAMNLLNKPVDLKTEQTTGRAFMKNDNAQIQTGQSAAQDWLNKHGTPAPTADRSYDQIENMRSRGRMDTTGGVNAQPVSTILNLNLKSESAINTTIMLDGKVLATAIMPYIKQFFANDLVKATTTAGSSTKDYVV